MNATAQPTSYNGHSTDCLCVPCMNADLDATILARGGEEALDRINAQMGVINEGKVESERTRFAKPGQRCGRGVVRAISERQLRFLKKLLATRVTTSIESQPWFTREVDNISLAGARTMIDALLGCPEIETEVPVGVRMATPKQAEWLGKLDDREVPEDIEAIRVKGEEATFAEASRALDVLFNAPRKVIITTKETIRETAGLWELEGAIYRMKKARSGHFYAELLVNKETGAFEYARGMAKKVPAKGRKLSLEEAEELSGIMGCCCMCSRTLTATVDGVGPAARYIGPVCAKNF